MKFLILFLRSTRDCFNPFPTNVTVTEMVDGKEFTHRFSNGKEDNKDFGLVVIGIFCEFSHIFQMKVLSKMPPVSVMQAYKETTLLKPMLDGILKENNFFEMNKDQEKIN